MTYRLLIVLILSVTILGAKDFSNINENWFFTSCELASIVESTERKVDLIVLKDGTQIDGIVTQLPSNIFQFGEISLKPKEVFALSFSGSKMQVITRQGYQYIGNFSSDSIFINQYLQAGDSPLTTEHLSIDPSDVAYIVTALKKPDEKEISKLYFTIQLKSGELFPVQIIDNKFQLSNGWSDYEILVENVLRLNFDKVLTGTIFGKKEKKIELDSSIINDKFLHLEIANTEKNIGLTWDEVLSVQRGGFFDTFEGDVFEGQESELTFNMGHEEKQKICLLKLLYTLEVENICHQALFKDLDSTLKMQRGQVDSFENHLSTLAQALSEKQAELTLFKMKVEEKQNENNQLQGSLTKTLSERERNNEELELCKAEILNQQENIGQLDQYVATLKSCFDEDENKYRAKVEKLEQDVVQALDMNEKKSMENDLIWLREELALKETEIEKIAKDRTFEQADFIEKINLASSSLQMEKEVKVTQENMIESIQYEKNMIALELEDAEKRCISLLDQLSQIQSDRDNLESLVTEKESVEKEMLGMKDQLAATNDEIENYKIEIANIVEEMNHKNQMFDQEIAGKDGLQKDLTAKSELIDQLASEKNSLSAEKTSIEKEMLGMRDQLAATNDEIENYRNEMANLVEEMNQKNQMLDQEIAGKDGLQKDLTEKSKMIDQLASEKNGLYAEQENLSRTKVDDLNHYQLQIKNILDQLRVTRIEKENLQQMLQEDRQLISNRERKIEDYRDKLVELNALREQDDGSIAYVDNDLDEVVLKKSDSLQQENSELRKKLKESIEIIDFLKSVLPANN